MAAVKKHDFLSPPTQSGDLGTLSHYRVIDELGKGGMGYVFRAEDIRLKRSVALKVMNRKIAATPNSRRRFIHEARAMAAVHHDNVATIFDVGESNKTPFMAMEMLKGSTIETFNEQDNRLSYQQIIDYARQMATGLSAAHAQGIVHRDIKPANIWIEEGTDRIKILDFGLALASTPVDQMAGRGAVIGTPGYLSPEQARSEPLDDRSDLYSLGVVLYELCTGRLPLVSDSVPGQLIAILAHRPPPISELNADIPQPLCDLIHSLLRKEPRSRPKSATKLIEELDRVEAEIKGEIASTHAVDESLFDDLPDVADPLAAIPGPAPTPTAATAPAAVPGAATIRRPAAKAVSAAPAWHAYWPLAAIVAVVLLALPIMTFFFSGQTRTDSLVVAAEDGEYPDELFNQPTSQDIDRSTPQTRQRQAQPQSGGGANLQPQQDETKQDGPQERRRTQPGNAQGTPGEPQTLEGPSTSDEPRGRSTENASARGDSGDVPPAGDASPTKTVSANPPTPPPATDLTPPENSVPERPALKWWTISTALGRGADVMVQNGNTQNQGGKPTFGFGTRKGIETHHSYLRFDLAQIEAVKRKTKTAGIVMTTVREQPQGTRIRIYGIDGVKPWPEHALIWKNSFSAAGLHSFPVLADVVIADQHVSFDAARKQEVRISTPEFAKFIARSSADTVTLVLAGAGRGAEVVRFMSRENSAAKPPRLLVEAPSEAPKDRKDGGQ